MGCTDRECHSTPWHSNSDLVALSKIPMELEVEVSLMLLQDVESGEEVSAITLVDAVMERFGEETRKWMFCQIVESLSR